MGMGTPIDLGKFFGVQVRIDPSLFLIALIFLFQGLRHYTEPSLMAPVDVHAVFPQGPRPSAKVKAVAEFLAMNIATFRK